MDIFTVMRSFVNRVRVYHAPPPSPLLRCSGFWKLLICFCVIGLVAWTKTVDSHSYHELFGSGKRALDSNVMMVASTLPPLLTNTALFAVCCSVTSPQLITTVLLVPLSCFKLSDRGMVEVYRCLPVDLN